jgi:hypothetical protein
MTLDVPLLESFLVGMLIISDDSECVGTMVMSYEEDPETTRMRLVAVHPDR